MALNGFNFSRAIGGPTKGLRIDHAGQLAEVLACASRAPMRFEVPLTMVASEGAFAFASGWHPFVAAITGGPDILAQFYDGFQPKSLADFYGLAEPEAGHLGPRKLPWLLPPRPYRGEKGLGPEHGLSLFGPCTAAKVALEHSRLTQIVASIAAKGYLPDRLGDITGYFLVRRDEFRFVVRGGKHRAAALAAAGWSHLPVRLKPGWVPAVSPDTIAEWPLVHSGGLAAPLAQCVFDRYFDWNGTQQHRRFVQ